MTRPLLLALAVCIGGPLALGGMGQAVLAAYGRAYSTADIGRLSAFEVALVPGTQPWDDDGDPLRATSPV